MGETWLKVMMIQVPLFCKEGIGEICFHGTGVIIYGAIKSLLTSLF
jgi:hypothetical protein